MTSDWTAQAKGAGQYAEVNGINLYYETHGSGRPLILLHGGLGSGEMFGPLLPALAAGHQVIAVDLQGHGRTADIDRPITVQNMADDIAALITHLGLDKPDVMGYSLGGGVAFWTAVKVPTPTCSRRAIRSRCSSCLVAASVTAAGWAKAGQTADTRSRSSRV